MNTEKPMLEVSVSDGKYTVIQDHKGHVRALRNGEEWPVRDLVGDNLVLALAYEVDQLRGKIKTAKDGLIKMAGHRLMQVAQPARELINKI